MKTIKATASKPAQRAVRGPIRKGASIAASQPVVPELAGLAGRVVLVTGASSGIGAAIAQALANAGAELILMGRNRRRLERVPELATRSAPVRHITVDFEDPQDLDRVVRTLRATSTRLGAIIHAAGSYHRSRLTRAPPGLFARLLQVNVQAAIDLTVMLRPILNRQADVVFINSSVVQRPTLNAAYYAATKHALRALADSLREEMNADGTRVTSIFPGRTATPMQADIVRGEHGAYHPERLIQPADIAASVCAVLNLPRTVEVTELFLRPTQPPVR